uniref:Uncharacterized protein n=1 Tax=Haptolina brevifila TaxID=156173 RepID=A0A7S2FSX2_9EUKA
MPVLQAVSADSVVPKEPDLSLQLPANGSSPVKVDDVVNRLISLMPLCSFLAINGAQRAHDATPASERQVANLRTVRKAIGRSGDTGVRLIHLIVKLQQYRKLRGIQGDM